MPDRVQRMMATSPAEVAPQQSFVLLINATFTMTHDR